MRSRQVQAFTLLFFLSGATGLVYELLWVRLLYQSFGSTIQSVTTVVAAYMGGLGLGAYLLGARGDRHRRPAALYGRLEILIGCFGLVSPLVLSLAQHTYIALARGLTEGSAASVALRFGLTGLALLIPTTLMGGTLPVLTRAFTATDRGLLRISLGRLYGINTLGAVLGTALAGFVLIEHVGIRASLIATAAVNIAIGIIAIRLPDLGGSPEPGRQPGAPEEPSPAQAVPLLLRRLALVLLAATAFVSLLDEIAWTRVLVMVVGGSTYAFTLVLLCFLLGIGLGSALVARRSETPSDAVASTVLAQGVTAAGAALIIAFFSALPAYVLNVFQIPGLNAGPRLGLLGGAVAAVVLIPAVGMGMTFPLLTDLIASTGEARGADVGRAYLLNTAGSILGAVLTGFVLVTALGSDTTLRLGVAVNVLAALALAVAVSRGVVEGSALQRQLQPRVIGGAILATAGRRATGPGAAHHRPRSDDLWPRAHDGARAERISHTLGGAAAAAHRRPQFDGVGVGVARRAGVEGERESRCIGLRRHGYADHARARARCRTSPSASRVGDRVRQRRHHRGTGGGAGDGPGSCGGAGTRRARAGAVFPQRQSGRPHPSQCARHRRRCPQRSAADERSVRRDRLRALEPLGRRRRHAVHPRFLSHRPRPAGSGRGVLPVGAAVPAAARRRGGHRSQCAGGLPARLRLVGGELRPHGTRLGQPARLGYRLGRDAAGTRRRARRAGARVSHARRPAAVLRPTGARGSGCHTPGAARHARAHRRSSRARVRCRAALPRQPGDGRHPRLARGDRAPGGSG